MSASWTAYCPGRRGNPARLQRVSAFWTAYCPDRRVDPARLQACESILCSRLSGEEAWDVLAPVGAGSMEYDVPHLAEDPVALLC